MLDWRHSSVAGTYVKAWHNANGSWEGSGLLIVKSMPFGQPRSGAKGVFFNRKHAAASAVD